MGKEAYGGSPSTYECCTESQKNSGKRDGEASTNRKMTLSFFCFFRPVRIQFRGSETAVAGVA